MPGNSIVLLCEPPDECWNQRLAGVMQARGSVDDLSFLAIPDLLAAYREKIKDRRIEGASPEDGPFSEIFLFVPHIMQVSAAAVAWLTRLKPDRVYLVGCDGSTNRYSDDSVPFAMERSDYCHYDAHVFNRLAKPRNWFEAARSFVHFPYGFLYRCLGLGPVDAFGFRIDGDANDLASREPGHKLVACFGGSAAFSVQCLYEQMFTQVIQRALDREAGIRNARLRFTVLNFAQNSHVMLNQMLAYQMFCAHLRPDIVISHDGHNDLMWGQINDPFLVERGITYASNLEDWSRLLHGGEKMENDARSFLTPPTKVISAYLWRKRQFAKAVISDGGLFVWGLQPLVWAKKSMTDQEAPGVNHYWTHPDIGAAVRNLSRLFSAVMSEPMMPGAIDANVYRHFETVPADQTLFGDHVHLTPAGDAAIGKYYAALISRLVEERVVR